MIFRSTSTTALTKFPKRPSAKTLRSAKEIGPSTVFMGYIYHRWTQIKKRTTVRCFPPGSVGICQEQRRMGESCVLIISVIYLEYCFGGFGMPPAHGSPGKEVW